MRWLEYTILGAIVLGYLLVAGLYATQTPPWQAPDEPAHYNYIRGIAEDGCCPVIEMGDWDNDYLEQLKAARFDASLTGQIDTIEYEDHQPPLYYLIGAGVMRLAGEDNALIALRLYSVLLGAGVVICAYAIGRVMFPRRPGTTLGAAALVAFVPQHVAILASVNNDALALLLVTVTLLVCALYVSRPHKRNQPGWRWHVAMGVLVGLAFLTKTTAYFLIVIVVLAILLRPLVVFAQSPTGHAAGKAVSVFSAVAKALPAQMPQQTQSRRFFVRNLLKNGRHIYNRAFKQARRNLLMATSITLGIACAMGALWWARNSIVYGFPDVLGLGAHDVVVVGQLRTSERIAQAGGFGPYLGAAIQTTYNSFWGQFGWMALPLPGWAYPRIGFLLVGAFAGVVFEIVRGAVVKKQTLTVRQTVIGVLLGVTALFAAAAYLYYNTKFYQVQGRYLFTALIPFALLVAAGLDAWARLLGMWAARWWPPAAEYAGYLTPLVLAGSFGAFNLWLVRFVLPYLAT